MGLCEAGADDTPVQFARGLRCRSGIANWDGPGGNCGCLKQVIEMSDADRRAMGNRGRNLVETKFSWPRIGEQMRSVYEWVLGGGPLPEVIVK